MLSGCGMAGQLRAIVPARLRVLVLGLSGRTGRGLVAALARAADAYLASGRGYVRAEVQTAALPLVDWYTCEPPGSPCGPGAALNLAYPRGPAVEAATGVEVAVRGRTALDFLSGDSPPVWSPSAELVDPPDVVVAFDVWQYWLAPLALDLQPFWRGGENDRGGLPTGIQRYGRGYARGTGTLLAAAPLLRIPVVLSGALPGAGVPAPPDAKQPWTWSQWASAVGGSSASMAAFAQTPASTVGADVAAAMVAAFGGVLGRATDRDAVPAYGTRAAVAALSLLMGLLQDGRATRAPSGRPESGPTYWTDPFLGTSLPSQVAYPLPAGPSGRAVPCAYLCAWVFAPGHQHEAGADFGSYLQSPAGQGLLSPAGIGLPLRAADALQALAHGKVGVLRPAEVVDLTADLTVADLYGGEKTMANARGFDAVADGFVRTLYGLQSPIATPDQVAGRLAAAGTPGG